MAAAEDYAKWIVANKDKKGTPQFEAVAKAYNVARSKSAAPVAAQPAQDPSAEMTGGQQFAAGMGAGMSRVARGVRGLPLPSDLASAVKTGAAPRLDAIDAEESQARELEAPLMKTGAGRAGNVAGTAALMVPTALVPGANTLGGAAMIGGVTAAATTPGGIKERGRAALGGAIGGPVGIALGRGVAAGSRALGNRAAADGAENAVTNDAIRRAIEDGYRLPLGDMAQSGPGKIAARAAEGFGGKAATAHTMLVANQRATNSMIRRDLGLRGRGQISRADVDRTLAPHLAVYREAGSVSPAARQALHDWRQANGQARRYTRQMNAQYTVEAEDAVIAARQEAAQHLQTIEREAVAAGRGDLASRLQQSRRELGRIGSIEDALNEETGNVSATVLARMLDRGVPLQGGALRAARFATAFPDYARIPKSMPGVSKLDAAAVVTGLAAAPATGGASLVVAGMPLASYAARHGMMTRPMQALAAPSANPGSTRHALAELLESDPSLRALALSGSVSGR